MFPRAASLRSKRFCGVYCVREEFPAFRLGRAKNMGKKTEIATETLIHTLILGFQRKLCSLKPFLLNIERQSAN